MEVHFYPLVLIDMGGGAEHTPEDIHEMFDECRVANRRALAEKNRWVLVATTSKVPTAVERKALVDEANRVTPEEHKLCESAVLVIPNGFVRGIITLFRWTVPKLCPLAAAPTTDAAVRMAADRVRQLGASYSPELETRAARWFRRNDS